MKFFGENAKTTPPSVFFPVFVRFVKAYRVSSFTSRVLLQRFVLFERVHVLSQQAEEDNEQRKRQEQILMEKLLEQEAMLEENQKVSVDLCMSTQLRSS